MTWKCLQEYHILLQVIIFTKFKDADLAIWDYEYEDKILQYFRANNKARLGMTLGLIKEGFELRLLTDLGFTIDLFLMYKVNNEYQWNGYQGNRVLYRYFKILLKP